MTLTIHEHQHRRMHGYRRILLAVLLAAILAITVFNPFLAASFVASAAAATTITVPAAADTYVNSSYPTKNYGKATKLFSDGKPIKQGFVRFDTSQFTGSIASAKLRLYVTSGTAAAGGTINRMSNTTWSESTVTYNTRPAIDGVQVGSFNQVATGAWLEYDVTSVVKGPGVYSFGISQTGSGDVQFASREHSTSDYRPQLVITTATEAAPSPSPSPSPSPTPSPSPAPAPRPGACTMTIRPTSLIDGRKSPYTSIRPGDVVCLAAGTWGDLTIQNVAGSSTSRVTFRNDGGQVMLSSLTVYNSQHIKILGNGSTNHAYGIKVSGSSVATKFRRKTEYLEFAYAEIASSNSIALNAKTQATCPDGKQGDDAWDYTGDGVINSADAIGSSYVVHDLHFHHLFIRQAGTEALYIGSNDTTSPARDLSCGTTAPSNPTLQDVHIHDNIVQDFGRDGINIKGAPSGMNRVHHNKVLRGSSLNDPGQNGSVRLSDNTKVDVTDNWLEDNRGSGIADNGNGGNLIARNTILRNGAMFSSTEPRGSGIYVFGSASADTRVLGNTLDGSKAHGVYFASGRKGEIANNVISNVGGQEIMAHAGVYVHDNQ